MWSREPVYGSVIVDMHKYENKGTDDKQESNNATITFQHNACNTSLALL